MKKKKDKDWVVNLWAGKRSTGGRIRGWHVEVTVEAKSAKHAVGLVADMITAKSYIWGEKEKENEEEKSAVEISAKYERKD